MTKLEDVARAIKDQRVKDDVASGIPYTPAAHDNVLPMDYRAARAAIKALIEMKWHKNGLTGHVIGKAGAAKLQAILYEESETEDAD